MNNFIENLFGFPIMIYTVTGQQIYKGYTNRIDANKLNKGVYILKTTDSQGKPGNSKIRI